MSRSLVCYPKERVTSHRPKHDNKTTVVVTVSLSTGWCKNPLLHPMLSQKWMVPRMIHRPKRMCLESQWSLSGTKVSAEHPRAVTLALDCTSYPTTLTQKLPRRLPPRGTGSTSEQVTSFSNMMRCAAGLWRERSMKSGPHACSGVRVNSPPYWLRYASLSKEQQEKQDKSVGDSAAIVIQKKQVVTMYVLNILSGVMIVSV